MENCIQCKIISGEIPSYTIYEDDLFKVILDIFPSSIGHTLIIPKTHCENLFDLEEKYCEKIITLSQKISKRLKLALNCDGINILQNNGEVAGQTINHYHMHVIPRYLKDNVSIGWKPLNPTQDELNKVLESIQLDKY